MPLTRGFDVSFLTDWVGLQARYGISYGVARCMREGEAKDFTFDGNWARMGTLDNFVRMAYAFASPTGGSDAVDDARLFWQYLTEAGPLRTTDYFWLDLEKSALTQDATNDWAEAWFDEFVSLNRAEGYRHTPGVYMGQGYLMSRTGALLNRRFGHLWYPRPEARYDNTWPAAYIPIIPTGANTWADTAWERPPILWQSSFHWAVPGYPEHDANVSPLTLDQLRTLNEVPPMAMTEDSIAKAVWGYKLANRATADPDDTSSSGGLLSYAHAGVREVEAAILALPDAIAVRLGDIADPVEVRIIVREELSKLSLIQAS
jgi:hypothetical protein